MVNKDDSSEDFFSEEEFQKIVKKRQEQEKANAFKTVTTFRDEDDLTPEEERAIEEASRIGALLRNPEHSKNYREIVALLNYSEKSTNEKIQLYPDDDLYLRIKDHLCLIRKIIESDTIPTEEHLDQIHLDKLAENIYPDLEYKDSLISLNKKLHSFRF